MSEDYGMFGRAARAIGKHREGIGAKAVKEEMAEAAKDNAVSKGDKYREDRQHEIDEGIRERRRKRKESEG